MVDVFLDISKLTGIIPCDFGGEDPYNTNPNVLFG
jgi:hypothetical protein